MKPLAIAGIAAVVGSIALAILFPRFDPSAQVPLTLDRKLAVERARQVAKRYGVDAAGWRAYVTDQTPGEYRAYLSTYPSDPAAQLFGNLQLDVTLIAPTGDRRIRTVLYPDGRLASWKWTGRTPPKEPAPAPEAILEDFAGASKNSFGVAHVSEQEGVVETDWQWGPAGVYPLAAKVRVEQRAGALRSAALTAEYGEAFDRQYKRSQEGTFLRVANGIGILVWTVGFFLCVRQMVRGRARWRIPLLLLAAQCVWALVSFFGTTAYQEYRASTESAPDALITVSSRTAGVFFSFFWLPVFAAAGYAIRSAGNREKWQTLELISRGLILNRTVAEPIAIGTLGGIALAATPYLIAAVRLPVGPMDFRAIDLLVAPSATMSAIRLSASVSALAIFGFLFPFVRHFRKAVLFWGIFTPLAVISLISPTPFHVPGAALAAAALLFGGYLWLYLRGDLLTVMVAAIVARAAMVPCILWSQPLSSIRETALPLLTIGAAVIAASVYWAVRGPEAEERVAVATATVSPDADSPEQSDRERLQAEFQVARKAQQDALPADPPVVNGYTLAGWCEPAQQVGGDLYDFFPLPDGRVGIAVADVSGKGVPAALYMMVTKGLVTAVSHESNQLAYILEQTNLHLYRACRKKVFVTLAAVVLDPANLRMEYGRAGHNPVVWRRARRGQTTLVKPPGLGLGMTPGERFNRSLKIEELELEPEDAIVLYSDGVTEAVNHEMEQFGEERLMRSVEATDGRPAIESRDAILRDLAAFMGTTPARDDITLVVIRA